MTKIVTIADGMIAHGKNQLVQEIIDVGGCSGLLPAPVPTVLDLPTDKNTLGAPPDLTLGIVDGGAPDSGVYQYKRTIGGFLFDDWLSPSDVLQGVDYFYTGSGAPYRISVGVGGDTVLSLAAAGRDWGIPLATPPASVTDQAGGIQWESDGSNSAGAILNGLDLTTPGVALLIVKASQTANVAAPDPNLQGQIQVADGFQNYRCSWNFNGQANDVRFMNTTTQAGRGIISIAPYERINFRFALGFDPAASPPPSGRNVAESWVQGFVPKVSDIVMDSDDASPAGLARMIISSHATAGGVSSLTVDELHLLRIG